MRSLVETNQESIKNTINTMPVIFENVGQISINVRETTDKLKVSVPVILQDVECVTKVAKENIEFAGVVMENVGSGINEVVAAYNKKTSDFITYFHIIKEVLQIIYRTFSPSK